MRWPQYLLPQVLIRYLAPLPYCLGSVELCIAHNSSAASFVTFLLWKICFVYCFAWALWPPSRHVWSRVFRYFAEMCCQRFHKSPLTITICIQNHAAYFLESCHQVNLCFEWGFETIMASFADLLPTVAVSEVPCCRYWPWLCQY